MGYKFFSTAGVSLLLCFLMGCHHNDPNHGKFEAQPERGWLSIDIKNTDYNDAVMPTRTVNVSDVSEQEFYIKNNAPLYAGKYGRPINVGYELILVEGNVDPNDLMYSDSESVVIPKDLNFTKITFKINEEIRDEILDKGEALFFKIVLNTDDELLRANEDLSSIEVTVQ